MEIVNITEEEFDSLSLDNSLSNFYQTSSYGNLMSNFGFEAEYIKITDNNVLIGTSLILSRSIYLGFKYGYAPRGILVDYSNFDLIPKIVKSLKNYLFKKRYMMIKIDPLIVKSYRDKKGNVIEQNPNFEKIMEAMKKCDFIHCGFNNYMEAVKPRWTALLNISNKSQNELFFELDKNVRNKLRKASKFGIEIYKDKFDDIDQIYSFVRDKGNYSERYYDIFKEKFGSNFEIYLARINTETYVKNSSYLYEKEEEINDYINDIIQSGDLKGKDIRSILNKKMQSDKILNSYKNHVVKSTTLLKNYPEGLIIGGAIVVKNNNKITLLIDGFLEEYSDLCPSYLTKWKIIERYSNTNIDYFDLNAISGDFTDNSPFKGLNKTKLGYNAKAVEYIGEFNLIINKAIYSLYRNTSEKYNIKNQKK